MFIIYVIDLSIKNKMQRRVHIFTKFKNKHPWKYKKIYFFQLIHLKKILIFHICVSSENAQCLKQPFDKKTASYTVDDRLFSNIRYCQ